MADRQRQTFKANFRGVNTIEAPDAMPPGKSPYAANVRAEGDSKIRTRPGFAHDFAAGTGPITDIGSYTSLQTDGLPRILAHDIQGNVYLDDEQNKGTVGTGGLGASIVPFRPNASPQSWAYVANETGYDKFSAPQLDPQGNPILDASGHQSVLHQKAGIAEPQPMPQAVADGLYFHDFTGFSGEAAGAPLTKWVNSGTASHPVRTVRLQDTVGVVFPDPVQPAPTHNARYYISVTGLNQYPNTPGSPSGQNFGNPISYQIGELLSFGPFATPTDDTQAVVEDVFPAIAGADIQVEAITYFEGQTTNGRLRCVIVPSQIGMLNNSIVTGAGQPSSALQPPRAATVQGLRRGSMIQLDGGEVLLVENMIVGPNGEIAIETATTGIITVTPGGPPIFITGVLSLAIASVTPVAGQVFYSHQINFQVNPGPSGHGDPGLGTVTWGGPTVNGVPPLHPFTPNPFNLPLGAEGVPQENDLLHISISAVPDPGSAVQDLIQFTIFIDINDGTFEKDTLYYPVSTSLLGFAGDTRTPAPTGTPAPGSQFTTTQLLATNKTMYDAIFDSLRQAGYDAASVLNPRNAISINPNTGEVQIFGSNGRIISLNVPLAAGVGIYTELIVPLSSLKRTGLNHAQTLANAKAVQISIITAGTYTIGFGGIWVGGGGQPDTGSTGSPYYYRIVGRNSLTGAISNPSAAMRYGVTPRCQPVFIQLPAIYDDQIDTWDIYRYGASLTTFRRVGSAHATDAWYRDNLFDAGAFSGMEAQYDNYEPWPTVDVPWHPSGLTINVVGTVINILGPPSAFPTTISRWLTGTLVTINLNTTYTVWHRPVPITGGWQIQLLQAAGAVSNPDMFVAEPLVARSILPYLWGPDQNGNMFACGDPFRPGTFQFSKPNNPDAAPNNTVDLVSPSEPLLGGQILDGLSFIASAKRWWQLQPSQNPVQPWNPIETSAGRGLAAPWGHTTDGKLIYYWAKDCIAAMGSSGPAVDLTTKDLGNIFPQGGVPIGRDITYAIDENVPGSGLTIFAPDYRYAAQFRLSVANNILRAHYYDRQKFVRTLTLDMTPDSSGQPRMAWSVEGYGKPILTSYALPQPSATLETERQRNDECFFGDFDGAIYAETDFHNDDLTPITGVFATGEFDGGDTRVNKDWMDSMVDILAPAGAAAAAVANGFVIGTDQTIPQFQVRSQYLIPIGEESAPDTGEPAGFNVPGLGIVFSWVDDFTINVPGANPVRLPTTLYEWTFEWVPQPVQIKSWESLFTNCGLDGYLFIYRLRMAYQADAPVTLAFDVYDGVAPPPIVMPATGGDYVKTEFVPQANKGLLYKFHATSPGNFAILEDACEVVVCQWGRTSMCQKCNGLGGNANT